MKFFLLLISSVTFFSLGFAQAAVVHVNNPTYPGTDIPFIVNRDNFLANAGTGSGTPNPDEASDVCQTMGYGHSSGPYDSDLAVMTAPVGVRVMSWGSGIGPYDVYTQENVTRKYPQVVQIDCDASTSSITVRKIKYFNPAEVQSALNSKLPVVFQMNWSNDDRPWNPADRFCVRQGYDLAGSESTTSGLAEIGVSELVNLMSEDSSGKLVTIGTTNAIPQGVVCSTSDN